MQVRLRDFRSHLVESRENVVGGEHDRFRGRLGMAAPRAQDLFPGDSGCDSISRQDGFDRLAATRLEDAELSHAAELLRSGRPGLTRGGEKQVEPRFARL